VCAIRIGCLLSFNEGSREASEREFDRVFGAEQQHTALSLSLAYARDAHKSLSISANDPAIRRMFVLFFFSERGRKIGGVRRSLSSRATFDDAFHAVCECVQRFYDGRFMLGVCAALSLAEIDDRPL
jgi:hypothetical protein